MKTTPFARQIGAAAIFAAIVGAVPAQAASYTSLHIFGDSLSDTGNVYLYSSGALPPAAQPYAYGGFSNGLLWTDILANGLGHPGAAAPSLIPGGTNYAWAGARTNGGSTPTTLVQTFGPGAGFWGDVAADPNGLYVLVAGGNDMRDARTAFPGQTQADADGRQAAANAAAASLSTSLQGMAAKGVKNVMLANLPDLGATPEAMAMGQGTVLASSDASARFNAAMSGVVTAAGGLGLNVTFLDLAGIATGIRNDALLNGGATYGITNVFYPCAGFQGSNGTACDISAFSDALHPSARAHEVFGAAALAAVTAVPEPETALLFAFGLAGLMAWSRRRAA